MRYYVILFLNKIIIFNLLFVLFKSTTKDDLMTYVSSHRLDNYSTDVDENFRDRF